MANSEADGERAEALVWRGADGGVLLRLPNGDAASCDAAGNELTARMNGEAVQRDAQGNELVVRASGEVSRRDIAGGELRVWHTEPTNTRERLSTDCGCAAMTCWAMPKH